MEGNVWDRLCEKGAFIQPQKVSTQINLCISAQADRVETFFLSVLFSACQRTNLPHIYLNMYIEWNFYGSIIIPPLRRRGGGILFSSVLTSVRNQYIQPHFSQQPCITATSNLVWCFGYGSFTSLTEFSSASYLLPVSQLGSFLDSASLDSGCIL